jgi:hypothetical protein
MVIGIVPHASGDKWIVKVMPDGSQFEKNLWSSDAGTVGDLAQRINQRFTFICNPSHYTARNGSPATSLWINGVQNPDVAAAPVPSIPSPPQTAQQGAAFPLPAPMPQPPAPPVVAATVTPRMEPVDPQVKEARILREAASKVAAMLLTGFPPEDRTLDHLLQLSEKLVGYYVNGMDGEFADEHIPF